MLDNGQMFSTKDRDNDAREDFQMAELFTGAWWYGVTAFSSLNGPYHNGQMFSTKDRDNDARADDDLANDFSGAWWYGVTVFSSLNGPYQTEPYVPGEFGTLWWEYNKQYSYSMKETKMLIKPNQ